MNRHIESCFWQNITKFIFNMYYKILIESFEFIMKKIVEQLKQGERMSISDWLSRKYSIPPTPHLKKNNTKNSIM